MMCRKRDHFHVLIVCALQKELRAAKLVLENGTNSKFVNEYLDLPQFNMVVCERWNSSPLKVAMTSQPEAGGIECQLRLTELATYFSANVVVMTGICAGDENKYGNVEHGSVVIARRTTIVMGGKDKESEFVTFAQYKNTDERIIGAVDELVAEDQSTERPPKWVKYIPADAFRHSPRYVRELILEHVSKNPKIQQSDLIAALEERKEPLPGMTRMNYGQILEIMKDQENPWIRGVGHFEDEYVVTDTGNKYMRKEVVFPRESVVTSVFDSIVTIPNVMENLKEKMKVLKKNAADRHVKGVDMEAHHFMKQTSVSFGVCGQPGMGLVMKGISDYGSSESKVDYYQVYAASTSAAFLRHLMIEKQSLFLGTPAPNRGSEIGSCSVPSAMKSTAV